MCGIAGFIGQCPPPESAVQSALERMKQRGPDAQTHRYVCGGDASDSLHALFLHSRLRIIDLDDRANQPFQIGDCSLIFNGEIYNYVELRSELERQGATFHTTSDTEVLLQAYMRYGADCVKHFEGMWSFAIWDGRSRQLLLSRDRFGEKPLYYYKSALGCYFASEIKLLTALCGQTFHINKNQILSYLALGYKSLYKQPSTFFSEVQELPAGTILKLRADLKPIAIRYWQPVVRPTTMTLLEAIEGSRQYLFDSVRIRLRSDVPLAFCLSGGVDSAALVSIAAKQFGCDVATFSIIDSDARYNEYTNIMATIRDLGCRHTLVNIPKHAGMQRLKQLIAYHDSPIATTTYFIHSLLSEQISASGYRVAFSGTAADELYTGYYDHFLLHLNELRSRPDHAIYVQDWQKHIAPLVRNPSLRDPHLYTNQPDFRKHIFDNHAEYLGWLTAAGAHALDANFSETVYCDSLLRNRMLNELLHENIPVILHEDDLNSMCYSVENRSPYLDSRLFDFMYSVPAEHLIRNGYGKFLLRESVKGVLNEQVRLDRQKKGFNASVATLVDLKNQGVRDEILDAGNPVFELVQRKHVAALLDQDDLPNHHSKFLFNVINAGLFLEQHA